MEELVNKLLELYSRIDSHIANFIESCEIKCPDRCGRCCYSKFVEATPLEALPIVFEYIKQGDFERLCDKVTNLKNTKTCIFFRPDTGKKGNGRCGIYPVRPLTCRLFGFSTINDKYGKSVFAACKYLKKESPEMVEKAQRAIDKGLYLPNFRGISFQASNIDPKLGSERMHINDALKVALDVVGLKVKLQRF